MPHWGDSKPLATDTTFLPADPQCDLVRFRMCPPTKLHIPDVLQLGGGCTAHPSQHSVNRIVEVELLGKLLQTIAES